MAKKKKKRPRRRIKKRASRRRKKHRTSRRHRRSHRRASRRRKPRRPRKRRARRRAKKRNRRTTKRKTRRRAKKRRARRKSRRPAKRQRRRARPVTRRQIPRNWAELPNERLLDLRIADLPLRIQGTELAGRMRQLHHELRQRGFKIMPHAWLSDEWYSPDGIPGIAIPFFLAHPRLKRLERELMLEVEGATHRECMKLLRHEAGHALLNAYQLHRRRDWQQHFGRSSARYPDTYIPRPYSKRFVQHLGNWYAQSHPHEDWAETFAVWLTPNYDWRSRYRDWPALKKLEYVDRLMQEIQQKTPRISNHRTVLTLRTLKMTLREYYEEKQKRYGKGRAEVADPDLTRLFTTAVENETREKASHYIRRNRAEIIDIVSRWTSEYNYRVNEVLKAMITRCDELDLYVAKDDAAMKPEIAAFLTMLVANKLHTGGFRVTL